MLTKILHSLTVIAHAPPIFTEFPDNGTLFVGQKLHLKVAVLSAAEYFLSWTKWDNSHEETQIQVTMKKIHDAPSAVKERVLLLCSLPFWIFN